MLILIHLFQRMQRLKSNKIYFSYLFVLNDVLLLRHVDTVQKLTDILVLDESGLLDQSSFRRKDKKQISLQNSNEQTSIQTENPPDLETNSMSFPSKKISSLFFDITHTTPLYMRTLRIKRSPKKFLISTSCPASEMAVLIGKWAYTNLILYLNPFKTPLTMLLM